MSNVASVNDSDFETKVVKSTTPVLVDFYATWCGPCKALAPIVDDIAKDLAGKLTVVKCDIDEAQEIAASMGIMSVPTLILFKGGQEAMRRVGGAPKPVLVGEIQKAIG